jgi:alkanesulfonate monooxygenase SsuD/methylene tetrahydromethanopterin reductase-like flavin-dependent oxidoreductase (luciferase family)
MKLGLVAMPMSSRQQSLAETYAELADRVVLADSLGYHEVFMGEHFTSSNMPVASPLILLATLINQTRHIRLGTGVVGLPYHHPAIVASELAQFDHLSGGRLNFGFGPGGLLSDMELFGVVDESQRSRAMFASLKSILELWEAEAPFTLAGSGESFGVQEHANSDLGVGNPLRPLQAPHPPIFVTAMSPQSSSVRRAVEEGWSPISAHFCSTAVLKSHGEIIAETASAQGRQADYSAWRVARHIVVRASDAEAEDVALNPLGITSFAIERMWQMLLGGDLGHVMKPDLSQRDDEVSLEALIKSTVMFGSPKTVAEKIHSLRGDVGSFGHLLLAVVDGNETDNRIERETMELLIRDVLPQVRH